MLKFRETETFSNWIEGLRDIAMAKRLWAKIKGSASK